MGCHQISPERARSIWNDLPGIVLTKYCGVMKVCAKFPDGVFCKRVPFRRRVPSTMLVSTGGTHPSPYYYYNSLNGVGSPPYRETHRFRRGDRVHTESPRVQLESPRRDNDFFFDPMIGGSLWRNLARSGPTEVPCGVPPESIRVPSSPLDR